MTYGISGHGSYRPQFMREEYRRVLGGNADMAEWTSNIVNNAKQIAAPYLNGQAGSPGNLGLSLSSSDLNLQVGNIGIGAVGNAMNILNSAPSLEAFSSAAGHSCPHDAPSGDGFRTLSSSALAGMLSDMRKKPFSHLNFIGHETEATPQVESFLKDLNAAASKELGFEVRITALHSDSGHSDGHGGEHKHGNAIDLGFGNLNRQQQIRLGQWLARHPKVQDIGITGLNGKFGKQRQLADHSDHFHVRLA